MNAIVIVFKKKNQVGWGAELDNCFKQNVHVHVFEASCLIFVKKNRQDGERKNSCN